MRKRDLKKLKPGQKLYVKLRKAEVECFSYLTKWNDRIVYFHSRDTEDQDFGIFMVRSSKKVRSSTSYEEFTTGDVTVVSDLNSAVLSLQFNSRR